VAVQVEVDVHAGSLHEAGRDVNFDPAHETNQRRDQYRR
jgi:hypothetical protein